ncbi:sensor histidine kinase [Teredinibacter haidensis]|uniref:sensor histidine kinase n=1 Tax=Teredinibacter haidensis TaxID=2731755 RepID=UPI0009FAFA16|nr:sensor histidine kinase [Teredinibacter haidensis]
MPSPNHTTNAHMEQPWSWISLMFSAFYFFSFFFTPLTLGFITISLTLYFTFVGLFIRLTRCSKKHVVFYIVAMTVLGTIGSGQNPSSSIFYGYAAFFAGFYLTRQQVLIASLIITANLFFSATVYNLWVSYYIFPGLVPLVAMALMGAYIQQNIRYEERERQSGEEKRQLATVAERERIARDLHDTLGHTLSSIALKAQLAKKLGDRGETEKALAEIDEVAKLASETLSNVRQAISGYRHRGLGERLSHLQTRLEAANFKATITNQLDQTDAQREAAIILMVTEAVTNIIRHCRGNEVNITLKNSEGFIQIHINDNGQVERFYPGNGLVGIQERLQSFGGHYTADNSNGFRLALNLPMENL